MPVRKEDLRKVKISKFPDGSGDHNTNGYFHEWGKFSEDGGNGLFQITLGIVELEEGIVKNYPSHRLKFVDNF